MISTGISSGNSSQTYVADGSAIETNRKSTRGAVWSLERVLFTMAGTMTLLSAALAALVSPWFLLLTAFVGVNQLLYVAVHGCGASLMLKRFTNLKSVVYPER